MIKAPLCKFCGTAHWSTQPHAWETKVAQVVRAEFDEPAAPVSPRPSKAAVASRKPPPSVTKTPKHASRKPDALPKMDRAGTQAALSAALGVKVTLVDVKGKGGRPKKDETLSPAGRAQAYRERKRAEKDGGK